MCPAFNMQIDVPRPRNPRPIISIGAGGIVRDAHLPAYKKAGFPVVAIVDLDKSKAENLSMPVTVVYRFVAGFFGRSCR